MVADPISPPISPDNTMGAISIGWSFEPSNQKEQQKITLDFGSPDAFPWRLNEKSKEKMKLEGYSCGRDLVHFYLNRGEEKEKIIKLFEWLHEHGEFAQI